MATLGIIKNFENIYSNSRSMYALTRIIGQVLTCSCAYGRVLEPDLLVEPEFCLMMDQASLLGVTWGSEIVETTFHVRFSRLDSNIK